jgi:hypothetical protein
MARGIGNVIDGSKALSKLEHATSFIGDRGLDLYYGLSSAAEEVTRPSRLGPLAGGTVLGGSYFVGGHSRSHETRSIVYGVLTKYQMPMFNSLDKKRQALLMMEKLRNKLPKDEFDRMWREWVDEYKASRLKGATTVLDAHGARFGGDPSEEEIGVWLIEGQGPGGLKGAGAYFAKHAADTGSVTSGVAAVLAYTGEFVAMSIGFNGVGAAGKGLGTMAEAANAGRITKFVSGAVQGYQKVQHLYFTGMLGAQGFRVVNAFAKDDKYELADSLAQVGGLLLMPGGDARRAKARGLQTTTFKGLAKEVLTTGMGYRAVKGGAVFVVDLAERFAPQPPPGTALAVRGPPQAPIVGRGSDADIAAANKAVRDYAKANREKLTGPNPDPAVQAELARLRAKRDALDAKAERNKQYDPGEPEIRRSEGSQQRVPESTVRANAGLGSRAERVAAAKKQMGAKDSHAEAIADAHEQVPCAVGRCTGPQLKRKVNIMRKAGMNDAQIREAIERGLAGSLAEAPLEVTDPNVRNLPQRRPASPPDIQRALEQDAALFAGAQPYQHFLKLREGGSQPNSGRTDGQKLVDRYVLLREPADGAIVALDPGDMTLRIKIRVELAHRGFAKVQFVDSTVLEHSRVSAVKAVAERGSEWLIDGPWTAAEGIIRLKNSRTDPKEVAKVAQILRDGGFKEVVVSETKFSEGPEVEAPPRAELPAKPARKDLGLGQAFFDKLKRRAHDIAEALGQDKVPAKTPPPVEGTGQTKVEPKPAGTEPMPKADGVEDWTLVGRAKDGGHLVEHKAGSFPDDPYVKMIKKFPGMPLSADPQAKRVSVLDASAFNAWLDRTPNAPKVRAEEFGGPGGKGGEFTVDQAVEALGRGKMLMAKGGSFAIHDGIYHPLGAALLPDAVFAHVQRSAAKLHALSQALDGLLAKRPELKEKIEALKKQVTQAKERLVANWDNATAWLTIVARGETPIAEVWNNPGVKIQVERLLQDYTAELKTAEPALQELVQKSRQPKPDFDASRVPAEVLQRLGDWSKPPSPLPARQARGKALPFYEQMRFRAQELLDSLGGGPKRQPAQPVRFEGPDPLMQPPPKAF